MHIVVEDPSQHGIPDSSIVLACGSGMQFQATTDADGKATIHGTPSGLCTVKASALQFQGATLSVNLPAETKPLTFRLQPARQLTQIDVSASPSLVNELSTTSQASLTQQAIASVPVSPVTGFTDLLTRTTPGVAADSNGFAHPLGEHADTSVSLDGQPITDQQAKVFSNQLDPSIIHLLTATTGSPPAEFGGKTSLVVSVETKSGLGQRPSGSYSSSYGSFGSWSEHLAISTGGNSWGNFFAAGVSGSGRFLDTPEFRPLHDHGNNSALFDRVDWRPREYDLLHLNLWVGRSWFQTPNSYDAAAVSQDQRSQIRNANVAIGWTHIFAPDLLLTFTPFYRHDESQYFPSANSAIDYPATLAQNRTLTNAGFRLEGQYSSGHHTVKAGSTYWRTLLHERFSIGLTDPLYNALCSHAEGEPVAMLGLTNPQACAASGLQSNPDFIARLLPYDLSRGGKLYGFNERATVRESAYYLSDEIRAGNLTLTLGMRYDSYRGLSEGKLLQPRLGVAWRPMAGAPAIRASYARLLETPYNENLIFASKSGPQDGNENPFASYRSEPIRPGTRNQFNVGLEQAVGKHMNVAADYYWKFTQNAFDFDTLFNTPITFSVAWRQSKIDGLVARVNLAKIHGLSAYSVMGHVRSRFFTPQVGGLIFNSVPSDGVFRIDHGEEFEQTTNIRYELPVRLAHRYQPWIAGTWRFSSGLALPNTVPVYTDALALTADQQSQMGLSCAGTFATPNRAIRSCSAGEFGAARIRIPAPGTQDDDRNPVRVARRNLFDLSAGEDRLFKVEHLSVGVQFAVLNLTNRMALYNFLSTFSGTHFVAPRSYEARVHFTF